MIRLPQPTACCGRGRHRKRKRRRGSRRTAKPASKRNAIVRMINIAYPFSIESAAPTLRAPGRSNLNPRAELERARLAHAVIWLNVDDGLDG